MDTNARKNRSGTAMEDFIELYVKAICNKHGYNYLRQANAAQIKEEFGKDVPIDKAARQFDFAINTKQRVYLLEVNYYSGGGSKLKSVAGEFKALFELVTGAPDVEFIWVTDGLGWKTSWRSLLETFNAINYVVNIEMIERGILEYILTEGI